jgi:hypothetical protein
MGAATALLLSSIITNSVTLVLIHRVVTPNWRRVLETLTIIGAALLVPLYLGTYLLRFPILNKTLGFLFLAALLSCCYFGIIIFVGKMYKKGPFGTLLVIWNSFIERFKLKARSL